jgi:hypothetical protein
MSKGDTVTGLPKSAVHNHHHRRRSRSGRHTDLDVLALMLAVAASSGEETVGVVGS